MPGSNSAENTAELVLDTLHVRTISSLLDASKGLVLSATRLCVTRTFSEVSTQMPPSLAPVALLSASSPTTLLPA